MRQLLPAACLVFLFIFQGTGFGQVSRTNDFSYRITNNQALITAYDGPIATNVLIPAILEGKTVVSVENAFKYSDVLEVTLPPGLTKIEGFSFYACGLLTNLVVPPNVTTVGPWAFGRCESLVNVEFSSDLVQEIGDSAFSEARQLRSVRIPTNVTNLEMRLFSNCAGLTNVTIRGNLKKVGPSVFENCSSLKNLVFEGKVDDLNTGIRDRNGITIYYGAFGGSGLTNITFKKDLGSIRPQSFLNTRELRELIFEGKIGEVGYLAFQECSQLAKVTFQGDVEVLGDSAFQGCSELADVYFVGRLGSVGANAFSRLPKLRTLVLPRGLTRIGELAFDNCSNLQEVIFLGEVPPQNGPAIFRGCPSTLKVKYPQGAAGWASFPNYGNRSTEATPTVAVISNFPSASPIRLGQPLANSRLTGGTANVSGTFAFENTNTVPPGGISSQPVLFQPDLWYLDELKFNVQVQVLTNIPQVTLPATLAASVGRRFFHVVQASDGPNTFTQTGLPAGLALGAATGEIQGIPEEVGTHVVEISASNASTYAGLATFELKVGRGTPEIGTAPTASVIRAGQPLAASRLAGGIATNDLGVLPGKFSWLVADRRPAAGTSWQKVKFTPLDFTNHQPTVASIPVTVLGITSDLATMTLTNGVALSVPYALQANVAGARFQATGLPPGLKLDPRTGTVAGRPTRTGTYTATFTALPPRGERMAAQKSFTVVSRTAATYLQQALSFFQPGTSIP